MSRLGPLAIGFVALMALPLVCPAQMFADQAQYAATVVTASGQVSVLKDSQPWALSPGDTVQVKQVILTGSDGRATFRVSDGSTFEVFPNSQVVFRKNPPTWGDLLDVLVGRVKIHIQKLGTRPNPNRVLTPSAVISVRGTIFDVIVAEEDETTLVHVEEGEVAVQHALLPRGNPKILRDGESIRIYKTEPLEARAINRGEVAKGVLRAVIDAVATAVNNPGRGGGATPRSGGPTLPGDTTPVPPPPPPPPPPPGG
jgi:hypothetical protein